MAISLEAARLLIGKRILSVDVAISVGGRNTPPGTPWTLEAIDESGPVPVFKLVHYTLASSFHMDRFTLEYFRPEPVENKGE